MRLVHLETPGYAWYGEEAVGSLIREGGDTLLPPYPGAWTILEVCREEEAEDFAREWEKQS